MNILLLNFLLYFGTFLVFFIRYDNKKFNVHNFVFFIFSLIALLGYYTFVTGIYQDVFGFKDISKLSIIPYVSCYAMVFIIASPLRVLKITKFNIVDLPSEKIIDKISILILSLLIVSLLLFLYNIRNRGDLDFGEIYREAYGGESKSGFDNPILSFIYGKTLMLTRILPPILYVLNFYLLAKNPTRLLPLFFIFLCFVSLVPSKILSANRGGLFFITVDVIFFVVLFYYLLSSKIKRLLFTISGIALFVMGIYILLISYSRIGSEDQDAINNTIIRYFGEPFPNLGFNIWEKDINHPYGARFFPSLFNILGFGDQLGLDRASQFFYWENKTGIPILNFKTVFGDMFIEFGYIGAFVILFLIITFYRKTLLNRSRYSILDIHFFYIVFMWNVKSIFGFFFTEQDIIDLGYTIIFIFFLKKYIKKVSLSQVSITSAW